MIINSEQLFIFGNGENYIPTIHIKDLTYCILKTLLAQNCPQIQFCVDSQRITQKQLIMSIASQFDLPMPRMRTDIEAVFHPLYLPMTLDLELQSSFNILSRDNDI